MISLLVTQVTKRTMIGAAALLFMLIGVADLAAYDNAGLANIYATSLPTAEGVTLLAINFDGSLILGMSEGHLRGITASGLRGITASGLRGITASGLRKVNNQSAIAVFEEIPLVALGPLTY
ncbi:MAG: hypothetical protein OER85_16225, partial [Gammaproteobacteria bacterium]|nr:hypothetical protein [Gammaproteobacteria bacterium]